MADLTGFVEGTDGKGDDLSRHGGDLRFCPDFQSYRRRGDVFNIQRGADGGLAFLQRFRHGFARRALHQRDHAGSGVDQQIAGADGSARHVELESEFDRYLLESDGVVLPHTYDGSAHMRLTRGECVTVALFYPPATPANINACVRNMARATRFLVGKNRKRVQRLLHLTRSPAIEDQLMPEHGDDRWLWMDSEMLVLYNRALKRYPVLLSQLDEHMRTGEPLGQDFAPAFG